MADNKQMSFDMEKTYSPRDIEAGQYKKWEESGAFRPDEAALAEGREPFTIVMPPPNITGQLHMGHALDVTLPDVLIRFHRMLGDPTLWLPGTDHASIATEVKIVEKLKEEGIDKRDLGREGFLERAWQWKDEYGGRITEQLRSLGASCDWSRERFTMDEGLSKAVTEVFIRLHDKGLIYRGNRIISWCPSCRTALSDAEVDYEEQHSHLWHIRYPETDGGEGVVVATTRPETMLGDTAVAVNPEDERYQHLKGKTLTLPLVGRQIPVVFDSYVEKEFGTGAVKITPAHDPNDFEVAQRHGLPAINVQDDTGHMNAEAGARYEGLTLLEARKKVVADLEAQGLLVKIEDYTHNVGTCSRCHATADPRLSLQWFVDMKPLAEPANAAVREGKVQLVPERFNRIYFNWMDNVRDWCISRQLWWGHRIPVYYCDSCGEYQVAREMPATCPHCQGTSFHQDEDVLDTWFSSALWPFSTLGWPDQTQDLKTFYPTSVLVTGYDIIFFWVARMLFSGIEQMGEVPFRQVLFHGLVRDAEGRKMSKSLGNGIDPLEVIAQYGADALRLSLVSGVSPGADTRLSLEKVESARNFANKVWNASRFVLMNLDGVETLQGKDLSLADKWILTRAGETVAAVTRHLHDMEHGLAAQAVYDMTWGNFCDWYIEWAKSDLLGDDADRKSAVRAVLQQVLSALIRLLHPFMPYITETLYRLLPGHSEDSCMQSAWPKASELPAFPDEAARMESLMDAVRAVRNIRAEMKVPQGKKTRLLYKTDDVTAALIDANRSQVMRQSQLSDCQRVTDTPDEKTMSAVLGDMTLYIPMGDLVDLDKEIARVEKESQQATDDMARIEAKLNNQGFVAKAPPAVVQAERDKLQALADKRDNLLARLKELSQ